MCIVNSVPSLIDVENLAISLQPHHSLVGLQAFTATCMQSLYLYDSEHSDQRYCVLSYTQHAARTLSLTKQVFKTAFCAHLEVLALSFLFSAMYWCTSVRDSGVNAVGSFQNLKTKHQFERNLRSRVN